MEKTVKLYYDSKAEKFSLVSNETNTVVFESHNRIGWAAGSNPAIKRGEFEIQIHSNINPDSFWEFTFVDLYVKGKLLLPISKSYNVRKTIAFLGVSEIAKAQFWPATNFRVSPHTIVQLGSPDWYGLLSQLCDICNNYHKWMLNEMERLIEWLEQNELQACLNATRLTTVLSIVRTYDEIVPEAIVVYRRLLDNYCISNFCDLFQWFSENMPDILENHKQESIRNKVQEGNALWGYLKDYLL